MNKAGGNGGKIRAVEFVFRWEYFLFRMQIPMNIVREPYLIPRSSFFFFFEKIKKKSTFPFLNSSSGYLLREKIKIFNFYVNTKERK